MEIRDYNLRSKYTGPIILGGIIIGFLTVIAAIPLYISGDSSFSFLTHWISHLGIGPNGSNFVFNGGMIYSSIITWIFSLYFAHYLHKRGALKFLIYVSIFCGFLLGTGLLMTGVFPMELIFGIHNVAAGLFFYGGLFSCIVYGITAYFTPNVSKLHPITGFMTAIILLTYIIINSLPVNVSVIMAAEWSVFFAIPLWLISQGFLILRSERIKSF